MVAREYRQLSCRGMGNACNFLIRAETEEKALRLASDHLCAVHAICGLSPDLKAKISGSMKSIWCQEEQCTDIPTWGWG